MSIWHRTAFASLGLILAGLLGPAASAGTIEMAVPDEPVSIKSNTPVRWFETMGEAVAEATKRDRPIVLVFPEAVTTRHEWLHDDYARAFVNGSDVICARLLAPQTPNIPAGASAEQRQLFTEAYNKLNREYSDLIRKYNVGALPTVLFLSPDGDTVLRSYTRTMETRVIGYFRPLLSDFENYKKTRAALHQALKEKGLPTLVKGELPPGAPVPPGPSEFGPAIRWHETMAGALTEAAKADQPIMLVLAGGDVERHEWFYGANGRRLVNESGLVAARVLPPAELYISRDAKPEVVDLYRRLVGQMNQDYRALTAKYNVTSIPTILFLSPDGEQVLARHTRVMETSVHEYFKVLPGDFENYKKLRAMVKTVQKEKGPGQATTSGAATSPR
jgi:thioredoxin-related protein